MQFAERPPRELSQAVTVHWIWGIGEVASFWWTNAVDETEPAALRAIRMVDPEFDPQGPGCWVKRWIGTEAALYPLLTDTRTDSPAVLNAGHFSPDLEEGR